MLATMYGADGQVESAVPSHTAYFDGPGPLRTGASEGRGPALINRDRSVI